MRCLQLAAALLLFSVPAVASDDTVPSRRLELSPTAIAAEQPANFDLIDYHAGQAAAAVKPVGEVQPHTIFGLKRHVGFGAGYDNGIVHATVGLYITVAEWGKWNFGVPSPAVGFGRYRVYDEAMQRGVSKEESSIFVSLASVHYRAGRVETWGLNWYIHLEQVFNVRRNASGSQIGISLSRK